MEEEEEGNISELEEVVFHIRSRSTDADAESVMKNSKLHLLKNTFINFCKKE